MTQDRFEEAYETYRNQSEKQQLLKEEAVSQDKEHIVAVRKNEDGDLIGFRTSLNRELDYLQALQEAKNGNLAHVDVIHKYGRDILRSEPDGIAENNLSNLPEF
ncbi:DUF3892 domain-containing protein [Bacillus sp. AFS041924]|uniref:DUF3892 domain-containing protein n=1 Tax=Bacillus sp. AFS041924 TaxID=2033503 RepID=UPI000BFB7645|nr:DUF3892 domain-containing protein [Bacillus sp. AFS041924]PGS49690.1 hypothetical protein COC46_14545 [Bacillus sp. AFS041924]